jgi:cobalamin synthase
MGERLDNIIVALFIFGIFAGSVYGVSVAVIALLWLGLGFGTVFQMSFAHCLLWTLFLVVCAATSILLMVWYYDRKEKRNREGGIKKIETQTKKALWKIAKMLLIIAFFISNGYIITLFEPLRWIGTGMWISALLVMTSTLFVKDMEVEIE